MSGRLLRWYTIYTFRGLLPPNGILQGAQKITLRPSLAFSYIGSVAARHSSQTLQRGTREGITEISLLVCATYIPQGGHHVGHQATFFFFFHKSSTSHGG